MKHAASRRSWLPLATQLCAEGGSLLRNLLLARLLGAEEMGLAMLIALAMRIVEMAGALGADRYLVKVAASEARSVQATLHSLCLLTGLLLALVFGSFAALLAPLAPGALDTTLMPVAALVFVLRGLTHLDFRAQQRDGDFRAGFWVEGAPGLLAAALLLPLAAWRPDHGAFVWALLAQAAVSVTASHLCARQPWHLAWQVPVVRDALAFGLPLAVNGAVMFMVLQGDRVVVASLFDPAELGRFTVVAQCALLPALVGARLALTTGLPRMARLNAAGGAFDARLRADLLRHALLAVAGATVFVFCAPPLIGLLYGEAFAPESSLAGAFACAAGLRLVRAVPATALMARGQTAALLRSGLPRLAAVAVVLPLALAGASLATLVAVGAAGEALALAAALAALRRGPSSPLSEPRAAGRLVSVE